MIFWSPQVMSTRYKRLCRRIGWMLGTALPMLAASPGCIADSEAEFVINDISLHADCLTGASPLQSSLNTAWVDRDAMQLYFQTDSRSPTAGDTINIQVYQPEWVRAHLGEPITLADPRELLDGAHRFADPPVVRGAAIFAQSCPRVSESFGLTGTIVFERLGNKNGEVIAGELINGQLISLREDATVARDVSGQWKFSINPRRPFQAYPPAQDVRFPQGLLP